jgi:hypothetical protein
MNDQVNRAEATASTEAQNADAASVVPTPTTEDGGSGSTHCSPLFAFMSEQIGGDMSWGPEVQFEPEPQRIGNYLVLDENTTTKVL